MARTTGITYSSILSAGVPPNSWRNTGAFEEDDNRSFPVAIGFDFWYDGVRYTEVNISTNGYVDFSASTANGGPTTGPYGYSNTQYSAVGGTLNSLAVMYDDMTTQGATGPLGSGIRSLVTGTAPNRVMTIEWANMAVYQNTTPSLNFQLKLHETTGQIEYEYGTMTQGTANFSYTCGLNSPTQSFIPTVAQLKCQQTANTATFTNGQQDNLTQLPASNSRLVFTSVVPLNPAGALTFTGVQPSQMTLNWTNWATNEVGYVIYSSIDGVNYDFITQTAANATTATMTGLYSGTTYFWRVYAVTEGTLSNALTGTQATSNGITFISVATGNWGTASTWNVNSVPGPSDNVIITSNHVVTINIPAPACHNLTIGQGGAASLRIGSNNTARTFTVWGNIVVAANASFTVNTASNATHQLNLYGNITNGNIVDFAPDGNSFCNVSFLHPYINQVVGGGGATNRFNLITVDKGDDFVRMVDVTTATFAPAAGFLTLVNGTFRLSATSALTVTPFNATSDIPVHARLWVNGTNVTVNTSGDLNLFGELRVSAGTMNIGTLADDNLISGGGLFIMSGGNVNVAGRYDRTNTATLTRFTISAGTLTLATVGSTSNTNAPFMMDVVGSQFNQSGGLIIIHRAGGNVAAQLGFLCTGGVINQVTGGVLQIGDATTPAAQVIRIQTVSPVGGLRVVNANTTASLIALPLTVFNDVELQGGIFNANNLNVFAGRNWTNTGGAYTAGTNTTTFNGTVSSAINGTAVTQTFNHVIVSKTAGTTLSVNGSTTTMNVNNFTETSGNFTACATLNVNAAVASTVTLSAGTFTAGTTVNVTGNWTNNGAATVPGTSTTNFTGTLAQAINGTAASQNFHNVVLLKTAGTTLTVGGSTATLTTNNITETTGNFTSCATLNVNASASANVLLSSGTFTAGTTTNITGNWTNNGATFIPGTSTTNFTGTAAQAINGTAASQTFFNVVVAKTAGTTLSVAGSTTTLTTNNLTETSGNFIACATLNVNATANASVQLTAGNFTAGTTINVNGNWTNDGGTFIPGGGTVRFTGTLAEAINGTALAQTFNNLVVIKTAGTTLTVGGSTATLTVNNFTQTSGNFTSCATLNVNAAASSAVLLSAGTFTAGTTLNITGNWTNNGATTVHAASTTNFTGTLAQAINGTVAAQNFFNVVIVKTAGTTLSVGGSTVTLTTNNVTQTTGNFTAPATTNINASPFASLLITTGAFTAGNTINVTGDWTYNGGTVAPGTGTVNFTGTLAQVIGGLAVSQTFFNVNVLKTAGTLLSTGGSTVSLTTNDFTETTGNFSAPATMNINATPSSSLLLNAGTFTAGSVINIRGNWTRNGGTVVPGISTVNFTGTLAQAINGTVAAQNFYDVVVVKTPGTTLTVGGSTNNVTVNSFTLTTGNFTGNGTLNVNLSPASSILLSSGTFTTGSTINLSGAWTNNGASTVPGTGTINFEAAGSQSIGGAAASESFNHINFINGGTTSIGFPIGCGNLTINAGDTVGVGAPGFTVSMRGNWVNNGKFLAGASGTVICNGTAAQTIGGTGLTFFRNLTIQNGAGVSLSSNENIRGSLTLTTGMFTTTGFDFTLISDVNATARVAEITGGDITGNIIQQRYIFAGPTAWRQMCAPVSGATLQQWNDDLVTSGFPGSDFPAMAFYSVAKYNEAALGVKENGYSPPANVTDPITPNRGYYVYVGPTPVLVAVKGPAVKMAQSFALTRTVSAGPTEDGWNMISNPYPSTVDWDAAGWTRTNTDNVLYIWNPNNNQYASYVGGVGVNGGTQYIPSSQAFWVRAIGPSPAMSLVETVKSSVDQAYMNTQPQQSVSDMLSLTLIGSNGEDQTIVRFAPAATDSFDVSFDAMKFASMDSLMPYLASNIDSAADFSINALATMVTDITVVLRATVGVTGTYTIRRDSISNLPASMCVMLEDLLNGNLTQLSTGASYTFSISDTTSAPRFLLHFGPALTLGTLTSSCGSTPDGTAFAKGTGNGPWDYTWKNSAGVPIAVHTNIAGTDTMHNLVAGDYIIEVTGNNGYCGFRSDTVTVNGPQPIATGATMIPATCSYSADGEIHINVITGGNAPYVLTWPDGSQADSLLNLTPGTYTLIITDTNGCVDTTQFIVSTSSALTASFVATPDTVVLQSLVSFTNYSAGASSYIWDFGDTSLLVTTTDPVYSYSSPGTFTVTLVADDGTCVDSTTQLVFVVDNTGVSEFGLPENISVVAGEEMIGVLFDLPSEQHARIKVYDPAGKLYADQEGYVGKGRVNIPMTGAASEMYFVQIEFADRMYFAKVILVR
ncbi:MAG: fibronectin type III domain-containing protein [Bacteroidota bacterium]|nr:fibronectin type III domain-containing protein [Bacteroidota bacterium]